MKDKQSLSVGYVTELTLNLTLILQIEWFDLPMSNQTCYKNIGLACPHESVLIQSKTWLDLKSILQDYGPNPWWGFVNP